MEIKEFMSIRVIEDFSKEAVPLKKGDKFLTGTKIIDQINTKDIGNMVTYFEVIREYPNLEYTPRYATLEFGAKTEDLTQ